MKTISHLPNIYGGAMSYPEAMVAARAFTLARAPFVFYTASPRSPYILINTENTQYYGLCRLTLVASYDADMVGGPK